MKKLLGVLLVIVMALFGLAACTNGNDDNGSGGDGGTVKPPATTAEWIAGRRFSSETSQSAVADWIKSLDLKLTPISALN